MRVLLDANVPHRLRHHLLKHEVTTARFAGLEELQNGELLAAMGGNFDVLLTCDRGIPYQQNLAVHDVAIIVMRARSNRLRDLLPLVAEVQEVLATIVPGECRVIEPPEAWRCLCAALGFQNPPDVVTFAQLQLELPKSCAYDAF